MMRGVALKVPKRGLVGAALLAGAVAGSVLTYQLLEHKTVSASTEREVLYYRNPMGTGHISDKPMKDEMGMDYIPVFADEAATNTAVDASAGHIVIDPRVVQNIGVRTAVVRKTSISGEILANGVIAPNDATVATVTSRVAGYVEKLYVTAVGQKVTAHQPLFDLYSPELSAAFEEYLAALRYQTTLPLAAPQTLHRNATDLVVASHMRLQRLGVQKNQIKQVNAEGKVPRAMPLYATQSGTVLQKKVTEGAYITPGEELFTIADLSSVWLLADIYAPDFTRLRAGQAATVEVQGIPGKTFNGTVDLVYPTLDERSRTAKVRVTLSNASGLLRPDMYARAAIKMGRAPSQLTVPKSAVLRTGRQDLVIAALGEGRFQPLPVRLGTETRTHYVVESGLKEGESVVVSAQFLLDSESKLQEAVRQWGETTAPVTPAAQKEKTAKRPGHGHHTHAH